MKGSTLLSSLLLMLLGVSCGGQQNSGTLLIDTMEEINRKGNGFDDFKVYNNTGYFAIAYQLENTPENKARLLWLANNEDLGGKFRRQMLSNLQEGDILARVVKERKALVLAVQVDEMEYHVVYTPEEILSKVFKK